MSNISPNFGAEARAEREALREQCGGERGIRMLALYDQLATQIRPTGAPTSLAKGPNQ